jgi:hypothetical protein
MSRALPPDVVALVLPMPDGFAPTFEDHDRYVRWAATLTVEGVGPLDVELGFSKVVDSPEQRVSLRASAWQAMELARLGRRDLLGYCMVGRHKRA